MIIGPAIAATNPRLQYAASAAGSSPSTLLNGLIASWELNGDLTESVNGYDLSVSGTAAYVAGLTGQAVRVTSLETAPQRGGSSSPNLDWPDTSDYRTISMWVRGPTFSSGFPIPLKLGNTFESTGFGGSSWLMAYQDGFVGFGFNTTILDNTWYNLIVLMSRPGNPITADLWINGVKQTQQTLATTNNSNCTCDLVEIGSYDNAFFGDQIDAQHYNVWDRALTDDEIAELYNDGVPIPKSLW